MTKTYIKPAIERRANLGVITQSIMSVDEKKVT